MKYNALDNLASNGIINYDANAYIKGTPPRYIGNPSGYVGSPLDMPLLNYTSGQTYRRASGTQLSGAPSDAFISRNVSYSSRTHWKSILAATTIGALLLVTGVKVKNKIYKLFNAKKNMTKATSTKTKKTLITKITESIKKMPKSLKLIAGGLTALLGLYEVYKLTSNSETTARL